MKTIVEIDLTNQTYDFYELDEEIFYNWLGGRGLGLYYISKNGDYIIISRGVLSKLPGIPGRASAYFESPITNNIFYSNSGGNVQWMEPFAIIIKGRSDKPVYLNIENSRVVFEDASNIFNKSRYETFNYLESKHPNKIILSIGNSSKKDANLMNNKHGFFGRGGLGYVFRERNLKAVVVDYIKGFSSNISQEYRKIYLDLNRKLRNNIIIKQLTHGGTVEMLLNELGKRKWLPIDIDYEKYLLLWEKYDKTPHGCLGCPIQCKKDFEFWGGLISFYSKGFYEIDSIKSEYEKINNLGLDAASGDHMMCIKNPITKEAIKYSIRKDQNQLIITKLFRENIDYRSEDFNVRRYIEEVNIEIAVVDSLVVCGFTLYTWDLNDYSKILSSLGYNLTENDLYNIGKNIINTEKNLISPN